jgi:hypothetical protein
MQHQKRFQKGLDQLPGFFMDTAAAGWFDNVQ